MELGKVPPHDIEAEQAVLGSMLTDKEAKVITLRFGLEDGVIMSLKEVAEEFNLSPARIGQIEAIALRKLRCPARSRILKFYYEE